MKSTTKVFLGILSWSLSDVFLKIKLELWISGRETEGLTPFSYIMSKGCTINMTIIIAVNLDHWLEVMFVKFPHAKLFLLFFFNSFYYILFGRKTLCSAYTEGVRSYI